jgi:hypothetical protein
MNILTASVNKEGGIVSNYSQVQQALEAYVKVRNQAVFDSVKEKMANIAFKAAQNTYFAPRDKIRSELSNLPITKDNGRKRTGNTQYVGQYKLINWQRKNMGLIPLGGTKKMVVGMKITKKKYFNKGLTDFDKETVYKFKPIIGSKTPRNTGPSRGASRFMDGKSKKFITYRAKGSKFLRIGWAAAAAALGKPFEKGDFGSATIERLTGKAYGGGANITNLAPGSNRFEIYNGAGVFDLRRKGTPMRSSSDIARAREKQKAGLMKGIEAEIKSMYQLVIERNSQAWFGKKIKVKAI